MGGFLGTLLASVGIPLAVELVQKKKKLVRELLDWGEVLMENKMAMEPPEWVCTNHLLLLLEHGNRCVAMVKQKDLGEKACY